MRNRAREIDGRKEFIWVTFPNVIKLLKNSRGWVVSSDEPQIALANHRRRGVNANIILLSGACIEGFLAECLEAHFQRINNPSTISDRLCDKFLKKLLTAGYTDKKKMFSITHGKTLGEMMQGKESQQVVDMLFTFRNCVAHANSPMYVYDRDSEFDGIEFKLEGNYKTIRDYLKKNRILKETKIFRELKIKGMEGLFTNDIADYFSSWVQQYMRDVLVVIGDTHSIGKMVDTAFEHENFP